jgi:carbonic anhydrase
MAKHFKIIISVTLIILLHSKFNAQEANLNYANQLTWGNECIDDKRQSPINIPTSLSFLEEVGNLKVVSLNYSPLRNIRTEVVGGHSFTFKYDTIVDNHIILEKFGKEYKFTLYNVHVHCPAEHQIDSTIEYPCELHLVHQRLISGKDKDQKFKFLVVGLLLKESGVADNQLFGTDMDFSKIVTKGFSYYYYEGSLTTPPCSDQVNWLVRSEPVDTSKAQLDNLKNWIKTVYPETGNDRNVVDTGDRKVYYIPANLSKYLSISTLFAVFVIFLVFN